MLSRGNFHQRFIMCSSSSRSKKREKFTKDCFFTVNVQWQQDHSRVLCFAFCFTLLCSLEPSHAKNQFDNPCFFCAAFYCFSLSSSVVFKFKRVALLWCEQLIVKRRILRCFSPLFIACFKSRLPAITICALDMLFSSSTISVFCVVSCVAFGVS